MRRFLLSLLIGILLAAGGARTIAAQEATPSAPAAALGLDYPELRLLATDYAFEVSPRVPAGLTLVTMANDGHEPHHAQLMQLAEGQTFETLQTAIGQSPEAVFGLGQFVGGPAAVEPGGRSQVILDLAPGQYVALCFVESADGVLHLAKGMMRSFEVTGDEAATPTAAEAPRTSGVVVMRDFAFELPAQVAPGPQIWEVVNEGPQPHEIVFLRLAPGMTPDQAVGMIVASLASPEAGHEMPAHEAAPAESPAAVGAAPFVLTGGMQAMAPGSRGWAVLDLEPGDYLAVCGVPDPQSGMPHLALGMVVAFSVGEA